MLIALRRRLRREFHQERMLVESFAVFMGVMLILLPFEFAFFVWQKAFIAGGGTVSYPETFLDAHIPFIPEFIWPYWLYFLLLASAVWLPKNRRELARAAGGMLLVHFAGFVCYFAYPSAMHRFDLAGCETLSCTATGAIYLIDPGFGVFPSLHVALSVYMTASFFAHRHRARWAVALLGISIIFSTVLVKQHYIIDVPAGFLLGALGWKLSWKLMETSYEKLADTTADLMPWFNNRKA